MAMLDAKGIFPTVTVFIAFIITILCLFAGTQKNFLGSVDLLTVSPPVIFTSNRLTMSSYTHQKAV